LASSVAGVFDALRHRLPRIGRWPRAALAAACALLALDSAVSARSTPPPRPHPTVGAAVIVAARDLPAGRRLTDRDVVVARWPRALVPVSAAQRVDTVVGRRLTSALARREAVTRTRLLGRDLTTGLAAGLVAVPVPLADPHAADLLHPGDHVDLLAAPRADGIDIVGPRGSSGPVTVVGSRLLVLAALPGGTASGTELVVAANRQTAVRITQVSGSQTLAGVGVPP
jgi:pilus assembly protein CpaB